MTMARISGVGRCMIFVLLCNLMSGCGYALAGRGGFLPDYIETIAIPVFENNHVYLGMIFSYVFEVFGNSNLALALALKFRNFRKF